MSWPEDRDRAKERAEEYINKDPFPHIPRALLSKEHIVLYAAKTGMIFPADTISGDDEKWKKSDALKTASYETKPGHKVISYNEKGEIISQDLETGRRSKILQTIGVVALISLAIGLISVFVAVLSLVSATEAQLRTVENRLGQLEHTGNEQ